MPKGRRTLALLALLAASGPRGLSRDKVIALLWPESEADRGRNSLSQVLSSLRRELGSDDLVLGSAEIRLNADVFTSDVEDFEGGVAQGNIERAVAIPTGPFLDGFYLTDAPEFERWAEEQRARLSATQRDALKKLAVDADRRGDSDAAVSWWRRLAALDPTSALTAIGLMEALAASGDGPAALRHFHIYSTLLEQELQAEPDAAVVRLAERLRRGEGVTRRALTAAPTSNPAGTADTTSRRAIATVAFDGSPRPFWRRIGKNGIYGMASLTLLAAAYVVLRATSIGPFATLLSAGRLGPNELLLVADFSTTGTDSALSGPLGLMMRSGLRQSSVIEIVPESRIASALVRMARAPDSRIDVALAREIAQREGIKAVVDGTLTPLPRGGGYILSAQLFLASTGDELASVQESVDGPRELLAAVDRLSRKLRERIGESLKVVRADPPLAEVTTASLDALKTYTAALNANARVDYSRAIALLEKSIALDSNFAMAYRQLVVSMNNIRGSTYGIGGEQTNENALPRMNALTERAYQLSDRLPERERLQMISLYFAIIGDRDKARMTYEELLSKYPHTPNAANFYATSYLMQSREFARAESVYATLIATDTSVVFPYGNIVTAQIAQGKLTEARRSVERLARRFPNLSEAARYRSAIHYALGQVDSSEIILRVLVSSGSARDRAGARNMLTAYALLRGQIVAARSQLAEGHASTTAAHGHPSSFQDAMTAAQIELVFFNHRDIAVRTLDRALLELPRETGPKGDDEPYFRAASIYSSAGRPDRARAVLALYDRNVNDTAQRRRDERNRQWAMAHIALAEGHASLAVAEFRDADRLYAWPVHGCAVCIDPDLGRAFDRAGMRDSAIAVFEHFVNAPSEWRWAADAWSLHWILKRLGELYEMRGDREAAAKYYQKFLMLWKDADPELRPVVDDVSRRLLRLGPVEDARKD